MPADDLQLKKGSAEVLVLSALTDGPLHGYEIMKRISALSRGGIHFQAASLYTILARMEGRDWIVGKWVEAGGRRRRYYRLSRAGKQQLAEQRESLRKFISALELVVLR